MENTKSVCIIDDDPIHIFLVKKLIELNHLSNDIIEFNSAVDAYNALAERIDSNQNLPDVILLDINMPEWDGWQFLNEFKKKTTVQKPKIYITTSSDNPIDIDQANTHKCVSGFIIKPVTKEALGKILAGKQ